MLRVMEHVRIRTEEQEEQGNHLLVHVRWLFFCAESGYHANAASTVLYLSGSSKNTCVNIKLKLPTLTVLLLHKSNIERHSAKTCCDVGFMPKG